MLALLFPGQGSQQVGMGRDVFESSQAARDVFAAADAALGFEISRYCFEGPEEELRRTEIQQPALLTTSVALLGALREEVGVEPAFVAGSCAALMTGDMSHLDLCRSQLDMLWSQRREFDGVIKVPVRHGDQGWFDFQTPNLHLYIHLHYLSQSDEDLARLNEVFADGERFDDIPADGANAWPSQAWSAFVEGKNPQFPKQVTENTFRQVCDALDKVEADDTDPETRECYHFHRLNPVFPEGLVRMAMGTPAALYNGGLLQTHLCYFDPERRRPGLPQDVAALVSSVSADEAHVELVNLDSLGSREVIIQAGSFGEHEFTRIAGGGGQERADVDASSFTLHLEPGSAVSLHLGMRRYARAPSYALPAELYP